MKDVIYITGHKSPDTDSICSALSYAELKKQLGYEAKAVRLGDVSRETQFVLDYFGVEAPMYLETVKTKLSELELDGAETILPSATVKKAFKLMNEKEVKILPITDEDKKLIGITTLSDMAEKYIGTLETNVLSKSNVTIENIIDTLEGTVISGNDLGEISGEVVIIAMYPDDAKKFINKGDIVITGNVDTNQLAAIQNGASVLIVTGAFNVDPMIIEEAKSNGTVIISTPYDTFTASKYIHQSIPISYISTQLDNIVSFKDYEFLDDVKEQMTKTRFRSYPVVDSCGKIKGFISRYHLITQNKKNLILVDHNEKSQSVAGIDDAEILEVVDHHRIADVQTAKPIYFRNETVGCTCTIIAKMYFENGIEPSKEYAGLMCSAILSDTLKFKSPTCTNIDIEIATKLAKIAGINIDEYAMEMFKAGTSLKGKTPEEIFYQDFKDFSLSGYKIGIGQVNTMDIDGLGDTKTDILKFMEKLCNDKNYSIVTLALTDIIKEGSELLFVGPNKDILASAFNIDVSGTSAYLPGVVSRKKQLVPPISTVIER
ncbi:putative manganese-dependent inorganic diphosphatase [Clostridium cylindrosporum]|uniref:inorganic diphosphatase n=1 Tax=Clostridium cylindrosporum DSM 605 TaxID=1121307 RepID=A0A0J8DAP3_CLOCY|nr:putative manganese-dependent inorganic diphosphatase [Clostridium cylindrosporum]KMT21389.1 cobalt-dependent inorganic pyrophosphatase [Clostridium cylindrosporum DSM 605]